MAKNRSFKEYVANRFENELYARAKSYILANRMQQEFTTRKIEYPTSTDVDSIRVMGVEINDLPKGQIEFIVTVEAVLYIYQKGSRWDNEDECYPWLKIKCTADLDCNMDDFQIHSVWIADKGKGAPHPLDDALVPYMGKDQYDEEARQFLKRNNYTEVLLEPKALDPMVLAERMGIQILTKTITSDFSVFGQIFFEECETEFYDSKSDSMYKEVVSEKTIVVDPQAFMLRNLGSVNNTIVHECVHWDRHRKAFQLERLYNDKATQIKCEVVGGIRNTGAACSTDWMERQANALAPKILMPMDMFKRKSIERIKHYQKALNKTEIVDVLEPVITDLSTFYNVSLCAAKIRLVEAGYEEAVGVYTYIDGHYVRPHYFKRGSITRKQTFTIGVRDVAIQRMVNREFAQLLEDGEYIFVENHMCFNSPKYITYDELGNAILTEYARLHVDECCLIFDISVKSTNKYGEAFYTECVLYRDADSKVIFEAKFSADNNGATNKQKESIAAYRTDVLGLRKRMNDSFADSLKTVVEWSDMTEEKIAEAADIEVRTLQRLKSDEDQNPTIETIIALCVAMTLPPFISRALLEKAGHTFKANTRDFMYGMIIDACYTQTLDECNKMLIDQGVKPIGKTARAELKAMDAKKYEKMI